MNKLLPPCCLFRRVGERLRMFASKLNVTLDFRVAYLLSTPRGGSSFILVSVRRTVETSETRNLQFSETLVNDTVYLFDRFLVIRFKDVRPP